MRSSEKQKAYHQGKKASSHGHQRKSLILSKSKKILKLAMRKSRNLRKGLEIMLMHWNAIILSLEPFSLYLKIKKMLLSCLKSKVVSLYEHWKEFSFASTVEKTTTHGTEHQNQLMFIGRISLSSKVRGFLEHFFQFSLHSVSQVFVLLQFTVWYWFKNLLKDKVASMLFSVFWLLLSFLLSMAAFNLQWKNWPCMKESKHSLNWMYQLLINLHLLCFWTLLSCSH